LTALIWLLSDEDEQFVKIPIDLKKMPECEKFVRNYDHIEPRTDSGTLPGASQK
jgi:hypothetical protein